MAKDEECVISLQERNWSDIIRNKLLKCKRRGKEKTKQNTVCRAREAENSD